MFKSLVNLRKCGTESCKRLTNIFLCLFKQCLKLRVFRDTDRIFFHLLKVTEYYMVNLFARKSRLTDYLEQLLHNFVYFRFNQRKASSGDNKWHGDAEVLIIFPVLSQVAYFTRTGNAGKGWQNIILNNRPENNVGTEPFRVILTQFKYLVF